MENSPWEDFYTKAVVLGVDIGMKGIGIWLRKGCECLWAGTLIFDLPEAAPLRSRRLLRSARRARASRRHREVLLKDFCARHGLPWVEINSDPFQLRYRAVKNPQGLASKEALVVCLRHIIRHRGYDYHRLRAVEGGYPWGEELNYKEACAWAQTTCCSPALARDIRLDAAEAAWSESQRENFLKLLAEAEQRYQGDPLLTRLEEHFRLPPHIRPPARKYNFPREVIEDHLEKICVRHARFFGGERACRQALGELKKILNYHRQEPGALAERRIKACPFLPRLEPGQTAKCATSADAQVRRFKLLEFLASRTFVLQDRERRLADAALYEWLQGLLEQDIEALKQKTPRPDLRSLRKDFAKRAKVKLAPDNASHNKDYFEQLRDLLRPKPARLKARAGMSGRAAELLYQKALSDGFKPERIVERLQDYYTWRKETESGYGVYPQVEFLLGRYSPKAQRWVTEGWLQRIMKLPEVRGKLNGQIVPDYVIIECVGDIPRNEKEAQELKKEQDNQRQYKQSLCKKHGLPEKATDEQIRRVILFEQQNGLCPYTGRALGKPLDPHLQIDHIYPRERGGISEMNNLVLTHAETNLKKGKRTPYECRNEFPQIFALAQKMQWNRHKRALFLRAEAEVPDWQNTTRVAQLARHLRQEVARWLGMAGDPQKMAARIGTPSGFLTAVCRESWAHKLPAKNRDNLRHHLWDAAVLAHIPPGAGVNLVKYGGIFYYENAGHGQASRLKAMARYAPDVLAFEKQHAEDCLVFRSRRASTKQSRYEQTIYYLDEEGRLWVRKPLMDPQKNEPLKELEKHLENAGLMSGAKPMLSRKQLEAWLGNPVKPLRLRNKSNLTRVPVSLASESPLTLVPHKNRQGEVIGYKKATESYLRLEIWRGPAKDKEGRPQYFKRLIPHPRNMKNFLARGFHFKRPPCKMPKKLQAQLAGLSAAWGEKIVPEVMLRKQVVGELPPYAKKVGALAKGDLVRVPFDANGEICLPPGKPECTLWYRVTSIYTNGRVEMKLSEYANYKATPLACLPLDRTRIAPSNSNILAFLGMYCKKDDLSSHFDQRKP